MLMEMAGSQSCEGRAFQDNEPDEQNARGPNVEVEGVKIILFILCTHDRIWSSVILRRR